LVNGLNDMQINLVGIHATCVCKYPKVCAVNVESTFDCACFTHSQIYGGITNLWTSIMCGKSLDSLWHKRECLLGKCPNCGIQILKIYYQELLSKHLVKWKSIVIEIVGQTKDNKDKKVPTLSYNKTHFMDYIRYLQPQLKAFVLHKYLASWQMFNLSSNLSNCQWILF